MTAASPTNLSKFVRVDASPARVARIWAEVSARFGPERGSSFRSWQRFRMPALALTVVATVAVAIGIFVQRPASKTAWNGTVLETAADVLTVNLEDGSQLALAAKTRATMLNDQPLATAVRIERGKVTCDLARRPERRFSVFASDIEVRVTGTRFSVELEPARDRIEVTVERGSVLLLTANGAEPARPLKAGERWSTTGQMHSRWSATNPQPAFVKSASEFDGPTPLNTASPSVLATSATAEPPLVAASSHTSALEEPDRSRAVMNTSSELDRSPVASGPGSEPGRSSAVTRAPGEASRSTATAEPSKAKALFEQANAARRLGDANGAAQAYQSLLTQFPSDPHAGLAALELGRLRLGPLRDPKGAIGPLRMAIASAPNASLREDAMARLVEALGTSGDVAGCRAARAAYQRDYPDGVHAALVGRFCKA